MKKLIFAIVLISLFATTSSAQIATQKETTLNEMRNISMQLCQIRLAVDELAAKWVALGYAPAGSNPMTQADINDMAPYNGLPLADVQAIITVLQAYRTEMDTWSPDLRKIMP